VPTPPTLPNSAAPRVDVRVSGRANTRSWVYRRRLSGRLWNTTSCLTVASRTHSQVPAEVPVAVAEAVVEEEAAAVATLVAAAVERVVDDAASVEAAAEAALIVEAAAEAEVAVEAAAVAEAISYSAAVKSPSVRQLKKQLKEAHVVRASSAQSPPMHAWCELRDRDDRVRRRRKRNRTEYLSLC
jgi:hypothetical protein